MYLCIRKSLVNECVFEFRGDCTAPAKHVTADRCGLPRIGKVSAPWERDCSSAVDSDRLILYRLISVDYFFSGLMNVCIRNHFRFSFIGSGQA